MIIGIEEIDKACATTTLNVVANVSAQPSSGHDVVRPSTPNFEVDVVMVDHASPIFDSYAAMSDFSDDENEAETVTHFSTPNQPRSLVVKLKVSLPQGFETPDAAPATELYGIGSKSSTSTTTATRGIKRELPVRSRSALPQILVLS